MSSARAWVQAFPFPHAPESLDLRAVGGVPAFRTVEAFAQIIAPLMRRMTVTAPPVTAALLD